MPDNDRARASISATLTELELGHQALGIPIDEGDFEAWIIVDRIEKRMRRKMKRARKVAAE